MADGASPTPTPGAEEGIRLDPSVIKALAADSRRDILRALKGRRKTATELARELGLQKATVAEHLKRLVDAGLVARIEDERLWVYHELTPTGQGLLDPGRSRVFLALGLIILGLLAAVTVMGLYLYLVELPGGGVVALEPDRTTFHNAQVVDFTIDQRADLDPDPARLYPVTGGPPVPLGVAEEDGRWRFQSEVVLAPGAYKLRFSDTEPRFDAPEIVVHSVRVTAPDAEWWRGFDDALVLDVQAGGRPLEGVVFLAPQEGPNSTFTDRLPAAVEDGKATIPVGVLDRWATGLHAFLFEEDPRIGAVTAQGELVVAAPRPILAPLALVEGDTQEVQLFLAVAGGERPERVPVLVDGRPTLPITVTPHHLRVPLDASEPGTHTIQVGRLGNHTVTVHTDLHIAVTILDGPSWRLQVHDEEGPLAGTAVALDDEPIGTLGQDGTLTLDVPAAGRHVLTLHTATGPHNRTFETVGWTLLERRPDIALQIPDDVTGRSVEVTLLNRDDVAHTATLVGSSGGGYSARDAFLYAQTNTTTRLDLYPPMGGELRLFATVPSFDPILVRNETEGADDGAGGASDPTATTTPTTGSEPSLQELFGRAITDPFRVDIPQQTAPPPHEDTDLPTPSVTTGPGPARDDDRARTVLVVLAVVLAVSSLYLLRGRRRT